MEEGVEEGWMAGGGMEEGRMEEGWRKDGYSGGRVPIPLPLPRFRFFGSPGRPSSPPLDSPRNSSQNAPQERSGEQRYRYPG
eukprot:2406198-Pyramimonas_sp.AAC.1